MELKEVIKILRKDILTSKSVELDLASMMTDDNAVLTQIKCEQAIQKTLRYVIKLLEQVNE